MSDATRAGAAPDAKQTLKLYLQSAREALLWKLDGLGERDARWPLTSSGTNLLGLVKHVGSMEFEYFGLVFDRPAPEPLPWMADDAEDNDDMWATAEESLEWIAEFYRRSWTHADATIDALDLEHVGRVPWWPPERQEVTLHRILVHMINETARHAGHADIVREQIDGTIGLRRGNTNVPGHEAQWWADYVDDLKQVAREADRHAGARPATHDQPSVDALVVVDVQRAFVHGPGAVPAAQQLLAVVDETVVRARAAGTPVVLVQNDGDPGAPDAPDTHGWELAVQRADGDILVRKRADDAFVGTNLHAHLRERGVATIAVVGLHSEMCVAATVRGAMERGFAVVVPHDAHATQPSPAWPGVADEVPAAVVSRVAVWSLGDQVALVPHAADVRFTRSGAA